MDQRLSSATSWDVVSMRGLGYGGEVIYDCLVPY
jgi:hypothetical protein